VAINNTTIFHERFSTQGMSQPPQQMKIRDNLDLTFNDARQAYRSKSTWEILRAWIVFKLCSIDSLVENNDKVRRV
jgi:proline dehydrogenase